MHSESKNWCLPEKITLAVVLASSLLLAGCPASTPVTPSSSGSGAPGSSSSGGASGGSSGGSSSGGMGMPGSDGGMGMPGSDSGGQPGASGGSQGGGEDVWQPEGGGGMPGQGGGGQSSGREQAGTDSGGGESGGGETGDGESGDSSASTGMDDLLDMSLEDFDDSMPDLSEDTGAAGGAGGQGDISTAVVGEGAPGSGGENMGTANNGAMTTGERVAVLDARLERSTGQFDDLILQERAVIRRTAQSRPAPPGAGHGPGPGLETGGSATGREDYGIMPGGSAAGGSGGSSAGGNVARGAGVPAQARVYPVPDDIPDGDDDDVVAAQLREAAMREADPQLREKLWDEYRKYKGLDK